MSLPNRPGHSTLETLGQSQGSREDGGCEGQEEENFRLTAEYDVLQTAPVGVLVVGFCNSSIVNPINQRVVDSTCHPVNYQHHACRNRLQECFVETNIFLIPTFPLQSLLFIPP